MDAFYFIDKPLGISSFDIIRKLRKKFNIKKMGHTGTLDPLATWWMLIATWNYTKLIPYLEKNTKTYEFIVELNWTTSSLDLAETVEYISSEEQEYCKKNIVLWDIQKIISQYFLWKKTQVPPKYSAIRIDGKRAYSLARKGKEVQMKERKIEIFMNNILEYNYPKLRLEAQVSAGTYIRTIAGDLWKKLGTRGYITSLRRVKLWKLDIENSIELDVIENTDNYDIKNIFNKDYFLENFDTSHVSRLNDWLERIWKFDLEINKIYFIYDGKKITNIIKYDGKKIIPVKKVC